jgi:hypothetical protein
MPNKTNMERLDAEDIKFGKLYENFGGGEEDRKRMMR